MARSSHSQHNQDLEWGVTDASDGNSALLYIKLGPYSVARMKQTICFCENLVSRLDPNNKVVPPPHSLPLYDIFGDISNIVSHSFPSLLKTVADYYSISVTLALVDYKLLLNINLPDLISRPIKAVMTRNNLRFQRRASFELCRLRDRRMSQINQIDPLVRGFISSLDIYTDNLHLEYR